MNGNLKLKYINNLLKCHYDNTLGFSSFLPGWFDKLFSNFQLVKEDKDKTYWSALSVRVDCLNVSDVLSLDYQKSECSSLQL